MPGKGHGCYGEMQQDIKLPRDTGRQMEQKREKPHFLEPLVYVDSFPVISS